jgi:LPS export ABC transporter protein LptC
VPDSELSDAKIYLYNRGQVKTEILAKKIFKFVDLDSTMAYGVDVDIYDSTGKATTQIVGDSGVIREGKGQVDIYGNVVVIADDSIRLESDYLYWLSATEKIQTDAFVKITIGEDMVVTGWGMEADQDLFPFRILNQVSGQVSGAEKKIEDNK